MPSITERTYKWRFPLRRRYKTDLFFWHHSASSAKTTTPDDIHRWHLGRGWAGLAYNFVIMPNGDIVRGRPENTVGGHTRGYNSRSMAACIVGEIHKHKPTAAQLASIAWLKGYVDGKYKVKHLMHRDVAPTACPGVYFPWPIEAPTNVVPKAPTKPKSSANTNPVLRKGSTGVAVERLQGALKAKGYKLTIDGVFGRKTLAAVKAFQKRCSMKVDGIVGPKTWAALGY